MQWQHKESPIQVTPLLIIVYHLAFFHLYSVTYPRMLIEGGGARLIQETENIHAGVAGEGSEGGCTPLPFVVAFKVFVRKKSMCTEIFLTKNKTTRNCF